jgi:hypothetical protein
MINLNDAQLMALELTKSVIGAACRDTQLKELHSHTKREEVVENTVNLYSDFLAAFEKKANK